MEKFPSSCKPKNQKNWRDNDNHIEWKSNGELLCSNQCCRNILNSIENSIPHLLISIHELLERHRQRFSSHTNFANGIEIEKNTICSTQHFHLVAYQLAGWNSKTTFQFDSKILWLTKIYFSAIFYIVQLWETNSCQDPTLTFLKHESFLWESRNQKRLFFRVHKI